MPPRTAAQRRKEAKKAFDEYMAGCPKHQLLDMLADKWVTIVMKALADGSRRHSQIAREVAGVSQKMLTQTLRALERNGVVTRTVTPTVPARVDYELTPLGQSLEAEARRLKSWAEANMPAIERARRAYDAARAGAADRPRARRM